LALLGNLLGTHPKDQQKAPPAQQKDPAPAVNSLLSPANRQVAPQNAPAQAGIVFDVPSLLGTNIDSVRENLASAVSRDDEPVGGRSQVLFTKEGENLRVAYDPKTRRVTSLFIIGADRKKLLCIGNLTWAGNYDIEFIEQASGSGLWITASGSREPIELGASEKSAQHPPTTESAQHPPTWPPRTWTDASGKHQTIAQFVGCDSGIVTIKKVDGKIITFRIEQLSKTDQEWIRMLELILGPR